MSLDKPENLDPGLRLHVLPSERRGTGIFPCHLGSFHPMYFDYVAGKYLIFRIIEHRVTRRLARTMGGSAP
jgi:hypothetical protein